MKRPPPTPDLDTRIAIRVSHPELALMKEAAAREGRTLSNWIRRVLLVGLNAQNGAKK